MPKGSHWSGLVVAAAVLTAIVLALPARASSTLASITGTVHDSVGVPVAGALVIVSGPSMAERMAFTDARGAFSIPNLFAGEYSVKVTMPRFLPAMKGGIQLHAGGNAVMTVNLRNAMDMVRRVVSRDQTQNDDMLWTLRSSRSTQPIFHLADTAAEKKPASSSKPDYTGYVQLYSKSVASSAGSEDAIGSQFSLTMPLESGSKVTFAGQYSGTPNQPRGFGAAYQFGPADRHRTSIGLNVRQGGLVGDPLNRDGAKEVQVDYGDDFQWSDHIVLNYGAEVGRADAVSDRNYLRPRLTLSWIPQSRTVFSVTSSSQAPIAPDDPVRGKQFFDRIAYIPPGVEGYGHNEFAVTRVISESTEASAAVFRDRIDAQALFVTAPDGRRAVLIVDSSRNPAEGVRVHVNHDFRAFQAGLGYTTSTGLGIAALDHQPDSPVDIRTQLVPQRVHLVSARFKANVDSTHTQVTAVYRWASRFSTTRLDPYQRNLEYNDPSLSVTLAQNLPTWGPVPAKIQAILDARNVFDRGFGAKATQISQYPRLFKGGINIRF